MAKKPWVRALLDRFDRRAKKASLMIIDSVISEVGELTDEEMNERSEADFTFIDYETAIAGAAAATGERVLLAAELELTDLEPGEVIPPVLLEDILHQDNYVERAWKDLTHTFEEHLTSTAGVPSADEMIRRARGAADGGRWPLLTVPSDHQPQRAVLEMAASLRFDIDCAAERFDLDAGRQVEACMLATVGLVIGPFSQLLDPKVGTRLATETVLAVAMTAPMRRAS